MERRRAVSRKQKIQKKYGVSLTSGCLPTLIQLPVFYGLYRVIQNIPAYVEDMKGKYDAIVTSMQSVAIDKIDASKLQAIGLDSGAKYYDIINAVATDKEGQVSTAVTASKQMMTAASNGDLTNNKVIDVLDKISTYDWSQLQDIFGFTSGKEADYIQNFENMNRFLFNMNIADAPGSVPGCGVHHQRSEFSFCQVLPLMYLWNTDRNTYRSTVFHIFKKQSIGISELGP